MTIFEWASSGVTRDAHRIDVGTKQTSRGAQGCLERSPIHEIGWTSKVKAGDEK